MTKQNTQKFYDDLLEELRPAASLKSTPASIAFTDLSEDSQSVVAHFGIEAPAHLNNYCCALEDALIPLAEKVDELKEEIKTLKARLKEFELND
jgi:polyhydroxyalkanoate synthesis regulator phasin